MTILNRKRLIADEGKILTNGKIYATVIDCNEDEVSNWQEINEEDRIEQ